MDPQNADGSVTFLNPRLDHGDAQLKVATDKTSLTGLWRDFGFESVVYYGEGDIDQDFLSRLGLKVKQI